MKTIPYGKQFVDSSDVQAVVQTLQSDFLTQGPKVQEFEEKLQHYCQSQHAVTGNSATSLLHVACLSVGLGPGDRLWTSPISFLASANCALYCGATVDFVDINPTTYNMCVDALEQKLIEAKKQNTLPKAVVPVHFAGQSCEMARIKQLSDEYGFYIIEDAAHAIGSQYQGLPVGSCQYSDIAVFSFHPVKVMTTAEGGALLTNHQHLSDKARLLCSQGVTRNEAHMQGNSHGPWYYQMVDLGFNFRMNDIQASLGIEQLRKLDGFVQKRNEVAQRYMHALEGLPLILPYQRPETFSAWHLFVICLDTIKTQHTRKEIFVKMREQGIGVNVHFIPIHTQPYYQNLGFKAGDFPNAEHYYQRCITLPISYCLTEQEQNKVIMALKEAIA